ncbi:19646_t:CDS:2 [Gigaspora margarita]|uniref:19646_t:CDS:1 n=1 Tax=Gigaspora margarita TaxID=4874 RepID=A0ABM8W351_GIGMA|nr:19646_t:CDS:2 [Gigaspora margarita]
MNEPNSIDIELEVLNNQNIEPKVSDNQDTEFEVPENEDIEYEISDNHNAELEILAAYDTISKKCKFGKLWELGRKVITNAIEDNNEHIYHELLGLFTSIQKKTLQKIIKNISVDGFNNSTNNNSCMLDIQNPIKENQKVILNQRELQMLLRNPIQ